VPGAFSIRSLRFNGAAIGVGLFQGRFHRGDGYDGRVIGDRVDLFCVAPAFFNLFDTVQPFQG